MCQGCLCASDERFVEGAGANEHLYPKTRTARLSLDLRRAIPPLAVAQDHACRGLWLRSLVLPSPV